MLQAGNDAFIIAFIKYGYRAQPTKMSLMPMKTKMTERMTFVTTPDVKASIMRRAERLAIPSSELIRCAVDQYDPDQDNELLTQLAEELAASTAETERKLDEALEAVRKTTTRLNAEHVREPV